MNTLFLVLCLAVSAFAASPTCCCYWSPARECLPGFPRASCLSHTGYTCHEDATTTHATTTHAPATTHATADTACFAVQQPPTGDNSCDGKAVALANHECIVDGVVAALGQAGTDVSVGYHGDLDGSANPPLVTPFFASGLCPVNVHFHLGAEHRSAGEYDETGSGPAHSEDGGHKREEAPRLGLQCHHYDEHDAKFTTAYDWKHCSNMQVGETYEVHWPSSIAGDCGTINQYQSPFADGVFCNVEKLGDLSDLQYKVGVQAQVFTIVNDEAYFYPDLIRGMIVDPSNGIGTQITSYTGSTTGTSRDNVICSAYAPITWQVDRKCNLISASAFDKLCADLSRQRDDFSGDVHPHGARELVSDNLANDNHQNKKRSTGTTTFTGFSY